MRKFTKRKVWYAKGSGLALAISGATITSKADLDKLRLVELLAIESFEMGLATQSEFRVVADLINLTETFASMGVGPESKPACTALQAALEEIHTKFKASGAIEATDVHLKAMREVFAFHDLQRISVDRSSYERAIVKCRNRIHGGHPSHKALV